MNDLGHGIKVPSNSTGRNYGNLVRSRPSRHRFQAEAGGTVRLNKTNVRSAEKRWWRDDFERLS